MTGISAHGRCTARQAADETKDYLDDYEHQMKLASDVRAFAGAVCAVIFRVEIETHPALPADEWLALAAGIDSVFGSGLDGDPVSGYSAAAGDYAVIPMAAILSPEGALQWGGGGPHAVHQMIRAALDAACDAALVSVLKALIWLVLEPVLPLIPDIAHIAARETGVGAFFGQFVVAALRTGSAVPNTCAPRKLFAFPMMDVPTMRCTVQR
jgi:hypothetical protein